jgi:hypothetical protein
VLRRPTFERLLDQDVKVGAMAHPVRVSREAGLGGKRGFAEDIGTEDAPFALVLYGDQDFAVLCAEHTIRRDGGMGEAEPRGLLPAIASRKVGDVHVLCHGVEHRDLQVAAVAGPFAHQQGFEDRRIGRLAGGDIADRDADPARARLRRTRHARQARFHLDQEIIGLALMIGRAGGIAAVIADNEPRKLCAEPRTAEAETVRRAGGEVLDEHIRASEHRLDQSEIIRVVQVDPAGFLAAVVPDEVARFTVDIVVVEAGELSSGRSSFMKRAATSASRDVASGAATACSSATTRVPSSARAMPHPYDGAAKRRSERIRCSGS